MWMSICVYSYLRTHVYTPQYEKTALWSTGVKLSTFSFVRYHGINCNKTLSTTSGNDRFQIASITFCVGLPS